MATYTITEPKSLHESGAVAIKVVAGIAYLGENIDLTAGEVTALTPGWILTAGSTVVTPKTTIWLRYDAAVPRGSRTLS